MTESEQQAADQVERDRRAKENELLLLMLIVFGQAATYADYAVRIGCDPPRAASNVINGSTALGLTGLAIPAATLLAMTYEDGARRAYLITGQRPPFDKGSVAASVQPQYEGIAANMASAMAATMGDKINEAIAAAPGNAKAVAKGLRDALATDGYGKDNPYLLRTVTEKMIVDAHGAGMFGVMYASDEVKILTHHSVLTDTTTAICRPRDGFTRPKDDPWWLSNWPSLHFGCRSIVLPAPDNRRLSTVYPSIPPAPGFGNAPLGFRRVRAA